MALYQNDTVTSSKLIIGNYKIETSVYASAAGSFTWVNLGAGMVSSFAHKVERYSVQAGNAPDPLEGISKETFVVAAELIEFDVSVLSVIDGGMTSCASTGTVMTVYGGGNATITERAFKLTNTRLLAGVTKETVITIFKATVDDGMQITAKSDNDTDPINLYTFAITGKPDTTRSAGSQLFTLTKTI